MPPSRASSRTTRTPEGVARGPLSVAVVAPTVGALPVPGVGTTASGDGALRPAIATIASLRARSIVSRHVTPAVTAMSAAAAAAVIHQRRDGAAVTRRGSRAITRAPVRAPMAPPQAPRGPQGGRGGAPPPRGPPAGAGIA